MKQKAGISLIIVLFGCCCIATAQTEAKFPELKGEYIGQTPPGLTPVVFAPGIVSSDEWGEHCQLAISPAGDEIFWSAWTDMYSNAQPPVNREYLFYTKIENGIWTRPKMAEFTKDYLDGHNGGPVFANDGKKVFFYSVNRPGGLGDMDTWFVVKEKGEWKKPVNAGTPLNTAGIDWSPVFTELGNAYSNFGATRKYKYIEGVFSEQEKIVIDKKIKAVFPVYYSPDESYLIYSSPWEGGYGGLDLYIKFRDANGQYGDPVNMGEKINTKATERFPVVSPDGKYLFFMKHTEPNQNFFWVSSKIIANLKREAANKE